MSKLELTDKERGMLAGDSSLPDWMHGLTPARLLEQCRRLKTDWQLPENGYVSDPSQKIRELKAGLTILCIDSPATPELHDGFVERIKNWSREKQTKLYDDFHLSVSRIITAIQNSIAIAPNGEQAKPAAASTINTTPAATADDTKPKKASINARMVDLITKRPESKDWSVSQFVVALGCKSKSGVGETTAWKQLMKMREAEAKQRQDRDKSRDDRGKEKEPNDIADTERTEKFFGPFSNWETALFVVRWGTKANERP